MEKNIVIFGAGSIGSWVGGELLLSVPHAAKVTLVHRSSATGSQLRQSVLASGLKLAVEGGSERVVGPDVCARVFKFVEEAGEAVASADFILVATKRHGNKDIAPILRKHAKPSTPIVLLQNGLNADSEMATLIGDDGRTIVASVVMISASLSVATGRVLRSGTHGRPTSRGSAQKANSDPRPARPASMRALLPGPTSSITFPRCPAIAGLLPLLDQSHIVAPTAEPKEFLDLQHGKLMLNMLNGPNAISGVPLLRMLGDQSSCALAAGAMQELATAYRRTDRSMRPRGAYLLPWVYWLFSLSWVQALLHHACALGQRFLGVDLLATSVAKSSMLEDTEAGRELELDVLHGEAVRLCTLAGLHSPVRLRGRAVVILDARRPEVATEPAALPIVRALPAGEHAHHPLSAKVHGPRTPRPSPQETIMCTTPRHAHPGWSVGQ